MILKPSPHDRLVNLIFKLSYSTAEIGSPAGVNGLLLEKHGYRFQLETYRDGYDTILGDYFHIPDGFIRNTQKRISITVECKSGIDSESSNLKDQLSFYSADQQYLEIFQVGDEENEIVVVCHQEILPEIVRIVSQDLLETNVVVWSVSKQEDSFTVQKKFGDHIDKSLDQTMKAGILELPPTSLYLINPDIPDQKLTGAIAIRLLENLVRGKIPIDEFITNQTDSIFPPKKIRRILSYVFLYINEFGKISKDGSIMNFKKRPKHDNIVKKIDFIYNLSKKDFVQLLKRKSLDMAEIKKKEDQSKLPVGQKILSDFFTQKEPNESRPGFP